MTSNILPWKDELGNVAYDRADKYFFSSNGFRGPTERRALGASALFGVSEKWFVSDPYPTRSPRFLFCNWYLGTGNAGNQEVVNGNAVTIEGVSISIAGAAPIQLTFGGANSIVQEDDSEDWTDANDIIIPANTLCCVRTAWAIANSALYISAPANGLSPMFKDKAEYSGSATLAAKVMAGGISATVPTGALVYALMPHAMVAKGNDGRPVGLIVGTSIAQGVGQSRFMRSKLGELGPAGLGMTSTFGGAQRYPAANFAVSGGYAAGITAKATGLAKRFRAFAQLPNLPFTFLYSDFGTNDQNATAATWKAALAACFAAFKETWPTVRVIQQTMLSRVASTDAMTTVANQTLATNWAYPAGSYWTIHSWFLSLCDGLIDAVIDIQDTLDNVPGGGVRGKWRVDILDGWATTLTAIANVGAASVTLAAQPRPGAILAFLGGTAEGVIASYPYASTASPFTVPLLAVTAQSHASASAVQEGVSPDGVHPGDRMSNYIADRKIAAEKLAGTFG